MGKAKPFDISKHVVWEAYKRVKANQRLPGLMTNRYPSLKSI